MYRGRNRKLFLSIIGHSAAAPRVTKNNTLHGCRERINGEKKNSPLAYTQNGWWGGRRLRVPNILNTVCTCCKREVQDHTHTQSTQPTGDRSAKASLYFELKVTFSCISTVNTSFRWFHVQFKYGMVWASTTVVIVHEGLGTMTSNHHLCTIRIHTHAQLGHSNSNYTTCKLPSLLDEICSPQCKLFPRNNRKELLSLPLCYCGLRYVHALQFPGAMWLNFINLSTLYCNTISHRRALTWYFSSHQILKMAQSQICLSAVRIKCEPPLVLCQSNTLQPVHAQLR